jgi:hypothetical protein
MFVKFAVQVIEDMTLLVLSSFLNFQLVIILYYLTAQWYSAGLWAG